MLLKKIAAAITSATMALTMLPMSAFSGIYAADSEEITLFCDDFENGDSCGWASHGGAATVTLSDEVADERMRSKLWSISVHITERIG